MFRSTAKESQEKQRPTLNVQRSTFNAEKIGGDCALDLCAVLEVLS
jgi:hypothetical protein